jgi:phosphoesterase RecJ-like protein
MINEIKQKIEEFDQIVIFRHSNPDGDAIGSQLGLKEAILATFPNKTVKAVGDDLGRFSWLGKMDDTSDDFIKNSLGIVCDSGSEKLIADSRYKQVKFLIKIDHHIPQGDYGDLVLLNTSSESCASILAEFVFEAGFKMTDQAATCFFLGMVTDSGRFRYSQTTTRTFLIASKLMNYQIPTDYIYNKIYTDKLSNVKLKAKLIEKFVVQPNGVAYLKNTVEDLKEYQITIFELSRGMVNIMAGIEEISIWANFCEDYNHDIYCELRSNGANINTVAVKYGGGGHLQASGCSLHSWQEVDCLIEDLNALCLKKGDK